MINSKNAHDTEKDGVKFSEFGGELLVFEIYLNNKHEMATSIELTTGDFTYYKAEEEVLLMPMFTF